MKKAHIILFIWGITNLILNIIFVINEFSLNNFKLQVVDLGMVSRINFVTGIILTFTAIMIKPKNENKKTKQLYWGLLALLFFNAVVLNIISTSFAV
jgi:hypothetical protein